MKNILKLMAFLVLALQACEPAKEASDTKESTANNQLTLSDAQLQNIDTSTVFIQQKTISNTLQVQGVIDVPPQSMVNISAAYGGYLKYTELLPGQKVRKGEVLAVLEDAKFVELQQSYLNTKNDLQLQQLDYKNQQELWKEKATTEKAYLQSKVIFENAKVSVRTLEEKLKILGIDPNKISADNIGARIEVRSPIEGYISKVNVNVGKYLSSNEVMFELVNPDDIHLNLQVFQKDAAALAIGQKVLAYSNEFPNKKVAANIILIGKTLNENKAVEVHCHFDNNAQHWFPGMYLHAEIQTENVSAYVLPKSAVVRFDNQSLVVIKLVNKTYELVPVKVLKESGDWTAIENGAVLENKAVLSKDAYKILMAIKNTEEE